MGLEGRFVYQGQYSKELQYVQIDKMSWLYHRNQIRKFYLPTLPPPSFNQPIHISIPISATMSGSTLPQAFKLVRNLLAERPRAFQEILRDGLPAAPSTSTSSASTTTTMRGKGKGRLVPGTSNVPEGHPFVSARYVTLCL